MTRSSRTKQVVFALFWLGLPAGVGAEEPIQLRETFSAGYQYHVSSRVDLKGTLSVPAEKEARKIQVVGESAIEYDERVLAVKIGGEVEKTARIYRRIDFQRVVDKEPQQSTLRPEVRRLVLLRHEQVEVPFSPDGPLIWGEIDLVRTDVFTPALAGLLPPGAVRVGDRWPASQAAVREMTDLERIEEGKIECRLDEVTTLGGRRLARIALSGTVRGVNEDGPNKQQLDGHCFFDLESKHVSYLSLKGVHTLLDKDGKEQGKVEGRFVLTRQVQKHCPDLAAEAWKNVPLEPNADNTLLLYDNPDLGIRFLHPRRWRVAGVRGRQVGLDESAGSGLLLTIEPPDKTPTGVQFLAETRDWFKQQKGKLHREYELQRLQAAPRELERFAIDATLADSRALLDYYVIRQPAGGATLAARLSPDDLANLQKEVERIARSVTISRPKE